MVEVVEHVGAGGGEAVEDAAGATLAVAIDDGRCDSHAARAAAVEVVSDREVFIQFSFREAQPVKEGAPQQARAGAAGEASVLIVDGFDGLVCR